MNVATVCRFAILSCSMENGISEVGGEKKIGIVTARLKLVFFELVLVLVNFCRFCGILWWIKTMRVSGVERD